MITLDTSGLFAYINRADPHNAAVTSTLEDEPGPWIIPACILTEVAWIIQSRLGAGRPGRRLLDDVLYDLESGAYMLDAGEGDFARVRELLRRYADIGLDFPDAAVIACGERNGGQILTVDYRHFSAVARGEGTIAIVPG